MKYLFKFVITFITICFVNGANAVQIRKYSLEELGRISAIATRIFEHNHYSQKNITPEISGKIFDEYFDMLDPAKMFFSTEDIDKFVERRATLGQELLNGEVQFAFQVYDLYKHRYHEFKSFAENQLKKGMDFKAKDTFCFDRTKALRVKNNQELKKLWQGKLKNDLLIYRLRDRALKESLSSDENSLIEKKWAAKTPEEKLLKNLRDLCNNIDKREPVDILGLLLDSFAQVYGSHSNYRPPKLDEDFEMRMSLSLHGIGAVLTTDDGLIKVVEVLKGSPAEKCGQLHKGDRIIAVSQEDGKAVDVIDMPVFQAVQYIRGPENSTVTLTVLPGKDGRQGKPIKVTLVRSKVKLEDDAAKGEIRKIMGDNGKIIKVGLINLPSFYMDFEAVLKGRQDARRASNDVRKILENFQQEKVDSVVIDLRRNGGGSLPDAIALTGLFISSGPVVQVRSRNGKIQIEADRDQQQYYTGPLVLLTSKLSASSSEIFSAALRDYSRALVVGDSRTFGKGTVLRVEQLDRYTSFLTRGFPAGSATYETAMFFRISGGSVQQLGISSDINLPSFTEELKIGEMYMDNHLLWDSVPALNRICYDPNLKEKIAVLKNKSMQRISKNINYQRLIKRIELFRRYKNRKTVSLNEEERWNEYLQEKQIADEAEKAQGNPEKKANNVEDSVLEETLAIAADYAQLK